MNDLKKTEAQEVGYQAILRQQQAELREGQIVKGELNFVCKMNELTPGPDGWNGLISAKGALTEEERPIYNDALLRSIQSIQSGGQIGCMDGRWLSLALLLGPKTAGGTAGNAARLMLASRAYQPNKGYSYMEALEVVLSIDKKLGFESGGHELGQCGAYKFAQHGILTVAQRPELVRPGAKAFLGALGQEYSPSVQSDLEKASLLLADAIPTVDKTTTKMQLANEDACPELGSTHKEHKELSLVVFTDIVATLNNNRLITLTTEKLGREAQGFGYNWGYHLAIARELGGSLGAYYLQSVPSQDLPVLMELTDGSLDIFAFKAA